MTWLFEPGRSWRPLDAALACAVGRRWPGLAPDALRLLALASFATAQGHGALDPSMLDDAAMPDGWRDRWHGLLDDCPAVDCAGIHEQRPYVLDGGLLYLRRFHRSEVELAAGLRRLARPLPVAAAPAKVSTAMAQLFPDGRSALDDDRQALACLMSLSTRLTVVLGGPGTGKTSTVLRLLALQQMLAAQPLAIAVAAPTGKAAARVSDAMQAAAERLDLDPSLRALLPDRAQTLHRLLGAHADGVRFRYGAQAQLPFDLVVVDEASMVDLELFGRLVAALPGHARLVVLGDPDQLEAIESGAVLADLARIVGDDVAAVAKRRAQVGLSTGPADESVGADAGTPEHCIVRLNRTFRFADEGGIHRLGLAIRDGDADAALAALDHGYDDLDFIDPGVDPSDGDARRFVRDRYASALSTGDPERMLAAHGDFRILAATRAHVVQINATVAHALGQRLRHGAPEAGLPFIVERNDRLRRLHNGDTGVFAADVGSEETLRAWLPSMDADGADRLRALPTHEIGAWQPAYAMTVHRAQGSEYDEVMIVLPSRMSAVMSRQWLYTAATRARRRLVIVGGRERLAEVISRHARRVSGLARRLAGDG